MTKVKNCTCKHDFQDKKYGEQKRLKNKCNKGWRCTVCGREEAS